MENFLFSLLDRYGIGVTLSVAAGIFFYRKVWPRIDQLIDTHIAFVGSCDATNKQQASSIDNIRDGQTQTIKKLDQVCTDQAEIKSHTAALLGRRTA